MNRWTPKAIGDEFPVTAEKKDVIPDARARAEVGLPLFRCPMNTGEFSH